jgi:hypothetical protein
MRKKQPLLTYDEVLAKWPDWTVEDASIFYKLETPEETEASQESVRLRVGYFLKFLQDNGLTRKVICDRAPDVPKDQVIYLRDITEEGFDLVRAARHTWYRRFDRSMNANPSDVRALEKELARIRKEQD